MKPKQTIVYTFLIAVCLVTGGILAGAAVKHRLQEKLIASYAQEETVIGQQVASTLQSKVENVENNLQVLALEPNVASSNPQVCSAALERATTSVDLGVGNVGRVNAAGVFYCSINKALIGLPASKLGPYVPQLIKDPQHNPVLSREIKVPNASGYVVALHVPVYDANHTFVGSLGGAVYLDQLASSYLDSVKFAQTGYASLQDDNGDILYSKTKNRVGLNYFSKAIQSKNSDIQSLNTAILAAHQGKSAVVRYTNQSGVYKIASVIPVTIIPNHRWIVIVNVPISEISAVFIHTGLNQAFNILAVVFCSSVSLIFAMLVAGTIRDSRLKKAEDQFISLVSHQLRTPLTSIRLLSEMMHKEQAGKLTPKQADYISKIQISTLRMIRLVGDILNVSRLELNRLKIEPEPIDLDNLVQLCIDELSEQVKEKGVTISYTAPKQTWPPIMIDPTLFTQVIHNLLTNAIRYSQPTDGKVEVSIAKTGKNYVLSVKDNGIGIPKKAQSRIFDRFYRAENAKLAVGDGTGLGLYLVKLILEESGCNIRFTSQEYHGTTFYVKIPLNGMKAKNGDKSLGK